MGYGSGIFCSSKNKTWHLVPRQQGANIIDCK
jgi:hypothetical protein